MSKVSYIPKDYNSVTPYLIVRGAAQAIEYYKKVFGATETVRMNGPDGKVGHAELKIGNSHIMLADENPSMGQGHTSAATQDQFYGDRSGFIQDPFGHLWGVATHIEDVSPKDMEERMKKMMPAA